MLLPSGGKLGTCKILELFFFSSLQILIYKLLRRCQEKKNNHAQLINLGKILLFLPSVLWQRVSIFLCTSFDSQSNWQMRSLIISWSSQTCCFTLLFQHQQVLETCGIKVTATLILISFPQSMITQTVLCTPQYLIRWYFQLYRSILVEFSQIKTLVLLSARK